MLIDDHPLAINGIGAWLIGTGRFSIAGMAENLAEAIALIETLERLPEIIILDVSLGEEDGLEFIPKLKEFCKNKNVSLPGILICSMYEDPFLIQQAMDMGARAYISKSAKSSEILTAIDTLLEDGVYINPKYQIGEPRQAWSILSKRENEIVSLVKRNLNNKQIAERLFISIRTVENHITRIYIKTGAETRDQLINL
jgi:NarL family two-component system response regulator LiaR